MEPRRSCFVVRSAFDIQLHIDLLLQVFCSFLFSLELELSSKMSYPPEDVDTQSGYCSSDGIYYSKRPPVWLPENPNLDLLTFLFAPQYGDKIALIDAATGESMTYKELERKIRVLAAGLYKRLGVRKGDVVMLLSPNSIEFPVIFCAVVLLGGAVTTVNQVNTAGEIQKQMKDAGKSKMFLATTELVLVCVTMYINCRQ